MGLKLYQSVIFVVGWIAYASTYFLRKPLGVIKTTLKTDLNLTTAQLGFLDVSLLLPYAAAQVLFGSVGDIIGARTALSVCLFVSGISMISFGSWNNLAVLCFLLFINGLAQSQCWPNCTKILATWFSAKTKNTVFGLYGTCAFAGGVLGTMLAVYLLKLYTWRGVHLTPSIIVICLSVVVFCIYKPSDEAGYSSLIDSDTSLPSKSDVENSDKVSQSSVCFILKLPGVLPLSISVFCLKLVRYCMYMWLPYFLEKELKYASTEAGLFSTVFEIGGVIGSAGLGYFLDRFYQDSPLRGVTNCIVVSALFFIMFHLTSTWGHAVNSICMFLAGAFNCGPDTILGAAVPNKIGTDDGRDCAAAVTGVVNGIGSIGPILEGPIITFVSSIFGWSAMFLVMVGFTAAGAISTAISARHLS